ncbi:MAG: hypothetical protein VX278_16355, partial [Myxococcota bacterium]|nr:hypothetical protein [Myxococcota bacterium]
RAVMVTGHVGYSDVSLLPRDWNQVWLCISSAALQDSRWLRELAVHLPHAVFVSFLPGLRDRELIHAQLCGQKLLTGLITFIAWQAPLPAEQVEKGEGIRYWLPPLTPALFEEGLEESAALLKRGGMWARTRRSLAGQMALGSSLLLCTIAALELSNWSFRDFRASPDTVLAAKAAREAMAIASAHHNTSPGMFPWMARSFWLRSGIFLSTYIVPFDIEAYLRFHFQKVGKQTELALSTWMMEAKNKGLSYREIEKLHRRLIVMRRDTDVHPTTLPDKDVW